jgi:hypothetical protein
MAVSRIVWAQRLAVAGLLVLVVYHIDEVMKASGIQGFLPLSNPMIRSLIFELPALTLSILSFMVSWKRPSIIVSLLVLIIGTLMVADGVAIGTKYLSVIAIPGPIIGLIYGVVVLSLGISKAIMTATALKTPALSKQK